MSDHQVGVLCQSLNGSIWAAVNKGENISMKQTDELRKSEEKNRELEQELLALKLVSVHPETVTG